MLEMGCQGSDLGCWPQPKLDSWLKGVNVFISLDSEHPCCEDREKQQASRNQET